MTLPKMPNGDRIGKYRSVAFGGYNHIKSAADGNIYDMQNMGSDDFPLLSVRKKRGLIRRTAAASFAAMAAYDSLYTVEGTTLCKTDAAGTVTTIGTLSAQMPKQFAFINQYVIIMPDRKYYHTGTDTFGDMESTYAASVSEAVEFCDGYYAGAQAQKNTIKAAAGINFANIFRVGDAVKITNTTSGNKNDGTEAIIREIDGRYLRFYENTFAENATDQTGVTIKREVPEMDYICENENRLWGCKGDTIYASKPGDPLNFNVFDGISTDSYALTVGSAGDFTACASFLGYPIFFKEEHIYKVYGAKPSEYQLIKSAVGGVAAGSAKSLAVAGETLFYLSRTGIAAYTGGMPESISAPFGDAAYKNAVGGSDGKKYYVSMEDENSTHTLFCYDTEKGMWHKEDNTAATDFAFFGGGLCFISGNALWRTDAGSGTAESDFASYAEFGDFTEDNPNRKGIGKLQLRIEAETGASVSVKIMYDSSGTWEDVRTLTAAAKQSFYLPLIPRRCDHCRLKLLGTGTWRLYSLVRESYIGSEI